MATIIEDYVSFETAKLLKEKGFDEICYLGYNKNGEYIPTGNRTNSQIIQPDFCLICCPTLQMAMKWLREVHNLHIMVNCIGKVNYDPIIQSFDGKDFEIDGVEVGITKHINGKYINVRRGFKTYENACEAAIKYCLINLI